MDFEKKIEKLKEVDSSNVKEALATEKLFIGDLLGDKTYYWSIIEREKYLNYYLKLLKKLGQYLFYNGDIKQASYI